jgi:hypothetical protein
MVNKCIKNCGIRVSYAGNSCDTYKKASGKENCNSNRFSSNLCILKCGSRVAYKGDMCLSCTEAHGLSSGDITGQLKDYNKKYLGPKRDAATAAAAVYESLHSNVDNSSRAQANAVAVGTTKFTVKLAAIQAKNPGHDVTASIFVASEGRGHLVLRKGRESSLVSKKQGSIVKLENLDGATYWRNLYPNEHKTIGPDAVDIYDATTSKIIANHVEWQVQLHVQDVLPDNVRLLQVKPGSGGCQGLPPYKYKDGARFIVHDKHGNLPLGAILKSEIPPGTAHISEKLALKKRSLTDYFKSG